LLLSLLKTEAEAPHERAENTLIPILFALQFRNKDADTYSDYAR